MRSSTPPVRFLAVTPDDAAADWLTSAVGAGADRTVTRVADVGAAYRHLSTEGADCVVVTDGLPTMDPLSVVETVQAVKPGTPVIVCLEGDAVAAAEERATAIDATGLVARGDDDALAAAVAEVVGSTREGTVLDPAGGLVDSIFEQLPVHVYLKDRASRHVRVSEAFVDDPERFVGRTDHDVDLVAWEHDAAAVADDRQVIETGTPVVDREEHLPALDQYHLTTKVPWYDASGAVVGVIGVTREVTARKRRERELERQRERLERFADVVSHDLRNPLGVARGYVEDATTRHDDPALSEAIDAIDRADDLVDDVLALARDGHADLDPQTVSVADVATEAWRSVAAGAATLSVETAARIRADRPRLCRLFENCFRNAVEHAGDGAQVRVGLTGGTLFVADDGPGIPAANREAVFEPGVSGSGGTGLGLAIVADIAAAHGWTPSVAETAGARIEFADVAVVDGQ